MPIPASFSGSERKLHGGQEGSEGSIRARKSEGPLPAEFETKSKKASEGWAAYAEDLKALVEKAFPDMGKDGREQLVLTKYMSQLDHPQVTFAVKQQKPKSVDTTTSATLEKESYTTVKSSRHIVGAVPAEQDNPEEAVVTVAGPRTPTDSNLAEMMQQLLKRMERLDSQWQDAMQSPQPPRLNPRAGDTREFRGDRPRTCWNCGKIGHISQTCRSRRSQQQGN